jgi:hypothetical protein
MRRMGKDAGRVLLGVEPTTIEWVAQKAKKRPWISHRPLARIELTITSQ